MEANPAAGQGPEPKLILFGDGYWKDRRIMAPLGYFLMALAKVIDTVLFIYMWIIIIRAVLSWVSPDPYNPIVRFINNITEPVLYQIRRRLPVSFGGIDLSPVVVLLIILFLQNFVVRSLVHFAQSFIH